MEKVSFCNVGVDGFVVLTIHASRQLAMLNHFEREWTIINDISSHYDDVIVYNGEFYGVDCIGKTVIVDSKTYSLKVVSYSVFGDDKKFLVENKGELFMVDKYLAIGP